MATLPKARAVKYKYHATHGKVWHSDTEHSGVFKTWAECEPHCHKLPVDNKGFQDFHEAYEFACGRRLGHFYKHFHYPVHLINLPADAPSWAGGGGHVRLECRQPERLLVADHSRAVGWRSGDSSNRRAHNRRSGGRGGKRWFPTRWRGTKSSERTDCERSGGANQDGACARSLSGSR